MAAQTSESLQIAYVSETDCNIKFERNGKVIKHIKASMYPDDLQWLFTRTKRSQNENLH